MKQILKTIIKDFHLRPLPSFRPRHLSVPLDLGKIITIIGPRRAGKTWYLFQLIARLEKSAMKIQRKDRPGLIIVSANTQEGSGLRH